MLIEALDYLCCPACRGENLVFEPAGVEDGVVVCPDCDRRYQVYDGVPRLIAAQVDGDTREKFGNQWRRWGGREKVFGRDVAGHREHWSNLCQAEVKEPGFFDGRVVLDAGCGHGMYVQVFQAEGARLVIGLDLTADGVAHARTRTRDLPNVQIVQGDILNLPVRPGVIDYVWSIGVIHHTSSPRRAFHNLARTMSPGGYTDIWVYPVGSWAWEAANKVLRGVTTRLPSPLLWTLCYCLVPALSVVKTWSGTQFGKNTWSECAQVIHDWLAPRYQSHHKPEELIGWFKEEGLEKIKSIPPATMVGGRRPGRSGPEAD